MPERTRRVMRANRSRDTGPELALRRELHRRGMRFYVCRRPLPGLSFTADVVFPRKRVAVFVDGCFWHGCPDHWRPPNTNRDFWLEKVKGNRDRDRRADAALRDAGWRYVRAWEHDPPRLTADRVQALVGPWEPGIPLLPHPHSPDAVELDLHTHHVRPMFELLGDAAESVLDFHARAEHPGERVCLRCEVAWVASSTCWMCGVRVRVDRSELRARSFRLPVDGVPTTP